MKKSVFFIPAAAPFRAFTFLLFFFFCAGRLSAATWYVKPSGSDVNAGNSWGAAYQTLTKALQSAAAGDQIWVAAGTYKPTAGADRSISFNMKNGVAILGGFPASGNPGLADRDWETNVTTLSGDIGTAGDNSDNSYHVVYSASLNNTAILNGFVVTAGNANGAEPYNHGGGLKNGSSSPTILYCSFYGNSATIGGGVSNFINSSAIFDHCNFSDNTAPSGGGGMYNYTSAPTVKNCSFSANSSSSGGGAVYNHTGAAPTFINSIFFNNTGDANGSTIKTSFSTLTLTNCSFSGNSGSNSTLFNLLSTATITNCNIWGNSSGSINGNGTITVSYSNVQGGYTGTGNLNVDPLFVNAPTDLRLQACSPVINKGNNAVVPPDVTTDLDDNNRLFGTVDMGAYEYQGNQPLPVAACKNATVQLDATGNVTVPVSAVDNGSTSACGIAALTLSKSNFNCSNVGANPVSLEIRDNLGNTAYCSSTITVQDNIAPTVVCKNATIQLDAAGAATITVATINNGSADNCGIATQALSKTTFNCSNTGANTVTLTVTDNNDKTATCNATVSVQDNTAPTAVCKNATVQLDASGNLTVPASAVNNGSTDACGIATLALSKTTFNCSDIGINTVTLTVTDNNGKTATCSAILTVQDNTLPTAICKNATVQLDASGNVTVPASAVDNGSTDACGIATLTLSKSNFNCSNLGNSLVSLEVKDINGNKAYCSTTITVLDNIGPISLCKNATIDLDAAGQATLTTGVVNNGSTDNCTISSLGLSQTTFTCANLGENTVTLTATDLSGNSATCTATVIVRDPISPTIICKSATIDLNAGGQAILTIGEINNGSAYNCTISNLELSNTTFTCENLGENIVTLTATDQGGNTASCTATVTVRDLRVPTIICKPAIIDLNASGQATLTTAAVNNGSTDNCTISGLVLSQTAFSCANLGENSVTLTATDQGGNSASCTASVTVRDLIVPTVICKPATIDLDATGQATLNTTAVNDGSTDNCTISSVVLSKTTFTCANLGENSVTLTATDQGGNSASCTATVTISDLITPIMVCKPATIDLNATGQATLNTTAVNNGSTDNCTISNLVLSKTTFTCANLGENSVTLTATDLSGNTATCSATVTVRDLLVPTIICKPATIDLNAAGQATLTTTAVNNGSTDNCTISSVVLSKTTFTCANLGENTVTLTATDQSGNSATCTATVTVRDLIAPTMSCKPATIDLNAAGQATLTTTAVNNGSTDNCTISDLELSKTTFTCANLGETSVTLNATDLSGNSASCTATVTVRDLLVPTVICKAATIELNASGQATLNTAAVNNGSTDNCTISGLVLSQTAFSCANLGENTVTMTATDPSGNSASCTAVVTVRDLIAPTMSCKPATIDLNASGQATLTTAAVNNGSTDNCTISDLELSKTTFTCANLGENSVTLTATDQGGNSASCTATVTVRDLLVPTVICKPATIDLNASGQATLNTGEVNNGSTDNCTISSLVLSKTAFSCANLGENTVTLTATDPSGNSATCTATVTVRDLVAPTMSCKPATINLNAAGQATLTTAAVNNGSTDNCTISSLALSQTAFTCANLGINTVRLTGTDQGGNSATCTAVVTVKDVTAPVAKCKAATANLGSNGTLTLNPSVINNGSTDNCSLTFTTMPSVINCSNIGVNTVTLIATDGGNNSASCTAQVTIKDVTPPTALCKNASIYLNSAGQATLMPAQVNNGSFDNCSVATLSISKSIFNCSELTGSPSSVTLTVKDGANNISTCLSQITVKDSIRPTAICVNTTVSLGADGKATVYGADLAGESFDNCSVWSFTPIVKVYTAANLGNNNLNITVKDWSGNAATCTSVVTVKPFNSSNLQEDRDDSTAQSESGGVQANLYPNPTMGTTNLALLLPTEQQVTIQIFDMAGRQVLQQIQQGATGENFFVLDFGAQESGMYIIEILTKEARLQKRLMVAKE